MEPTSVAPKISSTGAPHAASAPAARAASKGAVAEMIAPSGGRAASTASKARRCSGVVTRMRGPGTAASAAATSPG